MVKLVCLNCGQIWYSAFAGGKCDACQGALKAVAPTETPTAAQSNLLYFDRTSKKTDRPVK